MIYLIHYKIVNILSNEENIQELYEQIKIYEIENKSLNKKCISYEKENHNLINQINKLSMENKIMNQNIYSLKNSNKTENKNILMKYKEIMKEKIYIMKNKYIQKIGELKTMIGVLNCGMKKYNNIVMQYNINKKMRIKKVHYQKKCRKNKWIKNKSRRIYKSLK